MRRARRRNACVVALHVSPSWMGHEICIVGRNGKELSMTEENSRSHRGIGFDYQAALADPARQFAEPEHVRTYPWLTAYEKIALLRVWARKLELAAESDASIKLRAPSGVYNRIGFELHALGVVRALPIARPS
jgi:hypothetical protein